MSKGILSPKEEMFCRAYGGLESATYGKGWKSAEFAGYSGDEGVLGNMATKLKKKPHIITRLKEIYKENESGIGKCMSDAEHHRLLALEKGDIQAANKALEFQFKRHGLFKENWNISGLEEQQRQLSEDEKEEALAIAQFRLREMKREGEAPENLEENLEGDEND